MRAMNRRRYLLAGMAVLLMVLTTAGGRHLWRQHQLRQPIPAALIDIAPVRLAQPDAMIVSKSLRDLPRDLLEVPLLKAVLTEDFVFYYQHNSRLLELEGTLRRIAYEHHLSLRDDLVAMALDRPADIALWRGPDGKLSHWLIDTDSSPMTAALKLVARLTGKDHSLQQVGSLPLPDGSDTPLYRLDYGRQRSLFLAQANGHLLIFSDKALFSSERFGDAANRAKVWKALLDPRWRASPLRRHFGLQQFAGKHALVIDAAAVTFNYQHFTPDVQALRFDFDGNGWSSYLRLADMHDADRTFDTRALWQVTPAGASLCASAPVDWGRALATLKRLQASDARIDTALIGALQGPAAICWFADGAIYTPLLVASIQDQPAWDTTLGALFADSTGNSWARYRQTERASPQTITPVHTDHATVWQRDVPTDYGTYHMALARHGQWLVFSPDAQQVRNTLAVMNKLRPALADTLPRDAGHVIAVITPARLSKLLGDAINGDLPADREPLFHQAAAQYLSPRLRALAQFPVYALTLPDPLDTSHLAWQPVTWHALSSTH
jgi:uncharacterized protein YfaA (DUF2138 family)